MTQIDHSVRHFFSQNPDIRNAFSKGLVNRRALARCIIKGEGININKVEAVVSALRRHKRESFSILQLKEMFSSVKISTKDKLSILSLDKNMATLQKVQKVLSNINYTKNESLKIVDGAATLKIFIDESNVKNIRSIFNDKDILKIYSNLAEITMKFPEVSIKTKGIIAYVTSELNISNINIIELLTSTPELIFYTEQKDLLNAYETLQKLR